MKRVIRDFNPTTLREGKIRDSTEDTEDGHVEIVQKKIKGMRERLKERKTETKRRIQEDQTPNNEDFEEDYDED
jgi:hypothetical protein